jgi:hypothetical protein
MSLPLIPYERHENQAGHNENLLKENSFPDPCSDQNANYKDWNITILFYAAFHYVQAYLLKNQITRGYKIEFKNHEERNNYLARISTTDPLIAKVVGEYIALCKASYLARYTACHYHYIRQRDVCKHAIFALKKLPQTLGFV